MYHGTLGKCLHIILYIQFYESIIKMKSLLALALLVTVALCFKHDDKVWKKFKEQHNKVYSGIRKENKRRVIFEHHLDVIAAHNEKYDVGLKSYKMGINEHSDLSNIEFRRRMNGYRNEVQSDTNRDVFYATDDELPKSVNWTEKGAVTDIKNQQQCASVWAFSATGSVEGQHFLKTGKLVSLSEQNLMDCSGPEGCNGGSIDQGFDYIIKNKGIDTEASYPYTARVDTCHFKREGVGATISSYKYVSSGDEKALQTAVAQIGPISVAIDAGLDSFQHYRSGVYDEPACSPTLLDHCVLAVGYDTDAATGKDYWLVKNSWGTTWGINGYIKMSRNKGNQCGIATAACYPIV